jgi:hypothetical protein
MQTQSEWRIRSDLQIMEGHSGGPDRTAARGCKVVRLRSEGHHGGRGSTALLSVRLCQASKPQSPSSTLTETNDPERYASVRVRSLGALNG